jgi:hypothetical protein
MESISPIVVAFITGVLGPVLIIIIRNWIEKKKTSAKPDMLADALRIGELVASKIDQIREEVKADRVWVSQFHNGGHFYPTGKSIAKFSVIYETVNTNTPSIQANFQNIPVNLFTKSMNRLLEADVIAIPDFTDESISTFGLKYIAEESKTRASYLFAIKTIDDKFIGVLGVDFTKRKVKLDQDAITHLNIHASTLGGALISTH